jgi:hypothetical protein
LINYNFIIENTKHTKHTKHTKMNNNDSDEVSDYEECVSERVLKSWGPLSPIDMKKKMREYRKRTRSLLNSFKEKNEKKPTRKIRRLSVIKNKK